MNLLKAYLKYMPASSRLDFNCYVCGGTEYYVKQVIWNSLIREWQLSPSEAYVINLQQGMKCRSCHTHMRGNVLAYAILKCLGSEATSLCDFIKVNNYQLQNTTILEINEAGNLGSYLSKFPNHKRVNYPHVDMHNLSQIGQKYNLVIHSDTLEHIANPIHALAECKSVLADKGHLVYTVPVIPGRLSRDRSGLSNSSHSRDSRDDYHVVTEFGADFWRYPIEAGYQNMRIFTLNHPVALAIAAHA